MERGGKGEMKEGKERGRGVKEKKGGEEPIKIVPWQV